MSAARLIFKFHDFIKNNAKGILDETMLAFHF